MQSNLGAYQVGWHEEAYINNISKEVSHLFLNKVDKYTMDLGMAIFV